MLPTFHDLLQYVPLGLAVGAVYGVSGVGIVVLYRTTGVLNLAYGAIGALGAFLSWELINNTTWCPNWLAYVVCVLFGGVASLALRARLRAAVRRARAARQSRRRRLGLRLIFLAIMSWAWPRRSEVVPAPLPSNNWHNFGYQVGDVRVSWTQIIALVFAVRRHGLDGALPARDEARHGDAGARQRPRDHGDARRAGAARRGVGLVRAPGSSAARRAACCRASSTRSRRCTLTFLVISSLAAALIGRLESLWVTLFAALVIGIVESCLPAFSPWPTQSQPLAQYRAMTPFVLAIVALLLLGRRREVIGRRAGQ